MKKYGNEFKIGIIVCVALLVLGYMTIKAGDFSFKTEGYHVYVSFDDVAGLEKNAPVRLRGVEVGNVEDIGLNYDNHCTKILLTLWIDAKFKIRGAPIAYIRSLGLMGEKYIQLIDEKNSDTFLKPATIVSGKTPGDFEKLMDSAEVIAKNTNELILEARSVAQNINLLLTNNEKTITKTVQHLESASCNFNEFSEDLRRNPWKLLFKAKEKKKNEK
ncbi:MAG: MCE family protein [Candidatus Omnitrophica bacterium]|nr:MCE family protein [Candidatus Omnitrophota bacterium]